jgi:outer membrane protein OmpA-like peptidoglycan-associated protein
MLNRTVPLLLALLLAGGALYLVRFSGDPGREAVSQAKEAMATLTLPGGVGLSVPEGSFNFKLAQSLAGANDKAASRTLVCDHLNFEPASTKITPESGQTVKNLAVILNAYPAVNIRLEGYTDNEGAKEANQKLSQGRAEAIRDSLVAYGVASKRIETAGWGEQKPIASNDTAEGRAQNRRLEITGLRK